MYGDYQGKLQQIGGTAASSYPPTAPAPAPSTLVAAISNSGVLIDRLASLNSDLEALAVKIGGPWPADPNAIVPRPDNSPAMVLLCGNLDTAHRLVDQLQGAVKAISRSLEG